MNDPCKLLTDAKPTRVLPQSRAIQLVEVIADKLACPLRAGRLGSREQLEQAPLAIEHGNHGLAVETNRGDPEHLIARNTPEADGGSADLP